MYTNKLQSIMIYEDIKILFSFILKTTPHRNYTILSSENSDSKKKKFIHFPRKYDTKHSENIE